MPLRGGPRPKSILSSELAHSLSRFKIVNPDLCAAHALASDQRQHRHDAVSAATQLRTARSAHFRIHSSSTWPPRQSMCTRTGAIREKMSPVLFCPSSVGVDWTGDALCESTCVAGKAAGIAAQVMPLDEVTNGRPT